MGRNVRKVRHLHERDGRYLARIRVPENLRAIVGKTELLEPLGPDRALAITRLHGVVDRFHKILSDARLGLSPAQPNVSVRQIAHDFYAASLQRDESLDLGSDKPGRTYAKAWIDQFGDAHLWELRKIARGSLPTKSKPRR